MRYRDAKKLHNRDEVKVCISHGEWDEGYILGDPEQLEVEGHKIIEVTVVTKQYGLLFAIPHTALR